MVCPRHQGDTGVVGEVTAGGGGGGGGAGGAGGFLSVVDVPAIISEKLQQSKPYVNVEVPQIQFIVKVLDIPVATLRRLPTVQTAEDRRDPSGAVLGQG